MPKSIIKAEDNWEGLRKLGLLFFCLLLFDVASTGAGKYMGLGWFSSRIILTVLTLICGLPLYFRDFKNQIRKPLFILLFALLIYLGMEALRGLLNETPSHVRRADIMGFAWLGLIPLIQVLAKTRKDLRTIINTGLAGASLQAALCILFNILFAGIIPHKLPAFVEWIWEIQWGTILQVEYNAVRIFCRSSMYMCVACVLLTGRLMKAEKFPWKTAALFLLNFYGLFYTYTRSMYLTLLAGLLLSLIFLCRKYPVKRILLRTLIVAAVFLGLTIGSDIVLRQGSFQYAVARCFHRDLQAMLHLPKTWEDRGLVDMEEITENTNNTRALTLEAFQRGISESPLIGHGLGAVNDYRQSFDEYFYHDMLLRCGIVGLLLYLAPAAWAALTLWKKRKEKGLEEAALCFIGLVCFLIATYYNPWMNAVVGISWYAITLRSGELAGEESYE